MIQLSCAMAHSYAENFFENNLEYGIDNDLLLIAHSEIIVEVEGIKNEYPPYTAFYFPAGTPFYYSSLKTLKRKYEDSFIHFRHDDAFMAGYELPCGKPIYLDKPMQIISLIEIIALENVMNDPSRDMIIEALMKAIFLFIHDCIPDNKCTPHNYELHMLRYSIYQHPEYKRTLSQMAEGLHMSPTHLQKIYKKQFNISCTQDIIASRIQKARQLLKFSTLTINKVAFACGYDNVEHFCRQFLKETGKTPSDYRNS